LKDKKIFVAGAYNKQCLKHSNRALLKVTDYKNIKAIREMCLNSPNNRDTMLPDSVAAEKNQPALQMVSYDNFLKIID